MVVSTPSITSRPPSSTQTSTQRYDNGTNKIQRFQRRGKTPKTQSKGSGRGVGNSNLRGSGSSSSSSRSSSFGSKSTPKPKGSGKVPGLGTLGAGINARGDIDFGVYGGGVGATVSTRGDVSLGLGVASITWNFQNPNESALGFGFNTMTIEGSQEGCTITLSYKILGQIVNQEIRQADECSSPSEPDPSQEDALGKINLGDVGINPGGLPPPGNESWQVSSSVTNLVSDKPGYYFRRTTFKSRFTWASNPSEEFENSYDFIDFNSPEGWMTPNHPSFPSSHLRLNPGDKLFREDTISTNYDPFTLYYGGEFRFPSPSRSITQLKIIHYFVQRSNGQIERWYYSFSPENRITVYFYDDAVPEAKLEQKGDTTLLFYRFNWGKNNTNYSNRSRGLPIMEEDQEICYRVYEMLGGDTFYYKGLMIDNSMFMPGGKGMFRMKTYNEIMNIIFRTFSHRTVGEIEFTITDTNKGAKGNQSVEIKTVNAQGYFTNLMKTLVESKNENTDQLNVLVRLGLITSQLMKVLVIASENIKSIIGYLGVPQKDSLEKVDIPFDLSLNGQLTKGFSSREDLQKELLKIVDADTEQAIEGILDKFLDEWQMPVKVRKLRSSKEGGDFWFWLRQNLPK